ncbi:MAG: diphthamide biosynthesis enzyme Dph2 [Candidatus Bathyarchaeota archaeon]|nr:MAG: diphthamide biosynthesis enzyme Dph2 [Candidatus Bathyarchaeota archaeon]
MLFSGFDLEEKRIINEVLQRKAKRVLIQLPEGLKKHGPQLAEILGRTGALPIISADPCYGACDVTVDEAKNLAIDLIVHFGHSKTDTQFTIPVIFIDAKATQSVSKVVKNASNYIEEWQRVGLVTTLQHARALEDAKVVLTEVGKEAIVADTGVLKYPGQVTGCNLHNVTAIVDQVDGFLFIGGGRFHALGVALSTTRPTIAANPYTGEVAFLKDEVQRVWRRRFAEIHEFRKAKRIGVIVGLKIGQKRLARAVQLKKLVEDSGKKATILVLREITENGLQQFPTLNAFINTACPRLALDNSFHKPVLTPREVLVAFDRLEWETLCREGWFESEI